MQEEGVHHSRGRLELEGAQLVAALLEVLEVVLEVREAVHMVHELVVAQVFGLCRNAPVYFVETFDFLHMSLVLTRLKIVTHLQKKNYT